MTPPDASDVADLDAEVAALDALVAALREERDVLCRADAEALAELVPRKLALVGVLEARTRQREARMDAAGATRSRAGLEQWLRVAPERTRVGNASRRLFALIIEAARLNAHNRRLASSQARHFSRAAAALMRAGTDEPVTYGPDGREQVPVARRALGVG